MQPPRFEIFPGGLESESLRAGRRLPPLCDWCNFETPPPGAAPRPSEAGLGDYAKCLRPAPRPDWRPLFAAQLQETTPRRGQQVRSGEGLVVGTRQVPAPRWVSVSLSGEWGGRVGSAMGLGPRGRCCSRSLPRGNHAHPSRKETDRRSGSRRESWMGYPSRVQTWRSPPSGLSLHLRTMGALAFSPCLWLARVQGRGGVPRESGGGPWPGRGLCLG